MSMTRSLRITADVRVILPEHRKVTKTTNTTRRQYWVRSLFIHLNRTPDSQWQVTEIAASAATLIPESRMDEPIGNEDKVSWYKLTGFDTNEDWIQQAVEKAAKQVEKDSRGR